MNIDNEIKSLTSIDKDLTLQNFIAQANARYILYNTAEDKDNFPRYSISDDKLNALAFQYLSIGCRLIEKSEADKGRNAIERGASILEYIHASPEVTTNLGKYYGLISALSYYVSFQYSKSFILVKKIQIDTAISKLISFFLNRNYSELQNHINSMIIDEQYTDVFLSENSDIIEPRQKIYEIIIAKSLNNFVNFFYTGEKQLLETAKQNLQNLKEIAEIEREPDIWWVIRLLILITDGFTEASLWHCLSEHFDIENEFTKKYIQSLTYKKSGGIYELFITQRNSLSKVINADDKGCVVSIPTSSGKTRIAELAILDCISKDQFSKALFIAPYRSLAYEIENSLDAIFNSLEIKVSQLYGGSLFSKLDEQIIEESNVIVATPEKAKALLRSNDEILDEIELVIIDEGHLFGANERLIRNEIFYEELKCFIQKNEGRFIVLSAVLPNPEDLALWLTESSDTVYKENWRPSDERLGVLEWKGTSVSLNWRSKDKERDSFNPRFILSKKQPLKARQRRIHFFPENKNQAIVSTAYKLKSFGPVLIFVGLKTSVFTLAREYVKCIENKDYVFAYKNRNDWLAFEIACIESYGEDSEWLSFARKGILCHNADLLADVRLPLERLMRTERPLVIIATSTLGQGVNLGVSTVIFSTLYQAGEPITKRDFWNIAGRAGRAFVDHEGKILIALDTTEMHNKVKHNKSLIEKYFDKSKIDSARSGCLQLIKTFKKIAQQKGISFELLLQSIAENSLLDIFENSEETDKLFDWIDDGLLALHSINNQNDDCSYEWIDSYFKNSLSYIQALSDENISGEEVVDFFRAKTKGIINKIGEDKERWQSIIKSGIPLNSDLQIEERLDKIIDVIQNYFLTEPTVDNKVELLKSIEEILNDINVLSEDLPTSKDWDEVRDLWLNAIPMSEISSLENAINIVTKYYSYNLPWILNGISKKLKIIELCDEASIIEELSILVEVGLPNLKSVKVYQAGIRSRSSAVEIAELIRNNIWDQSIRFYKEELIENAEHYKLLTSNEASSWINLLSIYYKKDKIQINRIPDFTCGNLHEKEKRLIVKRINGKQYIMNLDLSYIESVGEFEIDFTSVNNINGVFFDYNENEKVFKLVNHNPNFEIL